MNTLTSRARQAGFTLLELMVAVAVLGVLAALAAPSFSQLLASQRVRVTAYNIVSDLLLARSEAVKRAEPVTVTPQSANWQNGWTVTVVSSALIISKQSGTGSGVQYATSPTSVTFDRNGRTNTTGIVRFALTNAGARSRCVSIDPSGRPKTANGVCPS